MNSSSGKTSIIVATISLIGVLGAAIISQADTLVSIFQRGTSLKTPQDNSRPPRIEPRERTPSIPEPDSTSQPPSSPGSESDVRQGGIGDRRGSDLHENPLSFHSTSIAHPTGPTQLPISTSRKLPSRSFSGTWNGSGYQCEGKAHEEIIGIRVEGNFLLATKIDAADDKCVPTGVRTFSAQVPEIVSEGSTYPVAFTIGSPTNPASDKKQGSMMVVDEDTLSFSGIEGIILKRIK